jgi:hypothetical protein
MKRAIAYVVIVIALLFGLSLVSGCSDGGSTLPPPSAGGALLIDPWATSTVGCGYLSTAFKVNITGGNPPYTVVWDFGDGSDPKVGPAVSHIYDTPGKYYCSCIVYDTLDIRQQIGGNVATGYVELNVFWSGV